MPPAVSGANVRVFDDLPDEHLKAVLHASRRSEDVPVAGWRQEQMAHRRQLGESRKAHLHQVRMQGNLAQPASGVMVTIQRSPSRRTSCFRSFLCTGQRTNRPEFSMDQALSCGWCPGEDSNLHGC
jgi:hypothetical protein